MASDKYQGFQMLCYVGIFCCDGEGNPLAIACDKQAAIEVLVQETAVEEPMTLDEARNYIERRMMNGDLFCAPIALRGAFQNDGDHENSNPEPSWIDLAFGK